MRENIGLFHGKRKDNGEWVEGYLFDDSAIDNARFFIGALVIEEYEGPCCDDWKIGSSFHEVIPETIGECTSVPDKNGKRIFEGDIVEGADFTVEDGGYGVVEYNDGAFEVNGNNVTGTFHENYWGREFEVIGNIHDNPELLKGAD